MIDQPLGPSNTPPFDASEMLLPFRKLGNSGPNSAQFYTAAELVPHRVFNTFYDDEPVPVAGTVHPAEPGESDHEFESTEAATVSGLARTERNRWFAVVTDLPRVTKFGSYDVEVVRVESGQARVVGRTSVFASLDFSSDESHQDQDRESEPGADGPRGGRLGCSNCEKALVRNAVIRIDGDYNLKAASSEGTGTNFARVTRKLPCSSWHH